MHPASDPYTSGISLSLSLISQIAVHHNFLCTKYIRRGDESGESIRNLYKTVLRCSTTDLFPDHEHFRFLPPTQDHSKNRVNYKGNSDTGHIYAKGSRHPVGSEKEGSAERFIPIHFASCKLYGKATGNRLFCSVPCDVINSVH